jgi:mannitol-1-/sugar-/sorbitol-6-phosphatase
MHPPKPLTPRSLRRVPDAVAALEARRFAAILFDMDGTLVDSTPAVVRCWLRWAQEEGIDPNRLQGSHGQPSARIVRRLVPAERFEAALARIDALEVGDTEGVVLLPGAAEALAVLAPRAAIVTSCTRPLAEARIAAAGLRHPEVVVTADDVDHGKPDPAPYLLAAQRLRVDASDCLAVEDAPSGLVSARTAGCTTLAVTTTHEPHELDADVVVPGLSAVSWAALAR